MPESTSGSELAHPQMRALLDVIAGRSESFPTSDHDIGEFIGLARLHRVDALIDLEDEHVRARASVDMRAELTGQLLRAEHRRSVADVRLVALLQAFDEMGVSVMVLKGWWTSRKVYAEPAQRRFTDFDVWVDPRSERSIGEIAAALRPGAVVDVEGVDAALADDLIHNYGLPFGGSLVELHKNPYGLKVDSPDLTTVWDEHARPVAVGSESCFEPSFELGLLVALVNYSRDCYQFLYQLVDIHLLAQSGHIDWDHFWALSQQQGLDQFAHGGLQLVADLFGCAAAPGVRQPRGWRRWWTSDSRVLRIPRPISARVPVVLLMPRGVRHVLRMARNWLLPSPEALKLFAGMHGLRPSGARWGQTAALNTKRFEQWRREHLAVQKSQNRLRDTER